MSESAAAVVPEAPEKPARGWAWWSGGRSPDEGVVSILALVETLLAMAVYGYIAWRWGTLHLTVSACLAPMLLLRTPASVQLGCRWATAAAAPFSRAEAAVNDRLRAGRRALALFFVVWLGGMASIPVVVFTPIVVRIAATLASFVSAPIATFVAIPQNWWRVVARVDVAQPLVPIPGLVGTDGVLEFWGNPIKVLGVARHPLGVAAMAASLSPFIVPVLAYRWAIKGTALIWSPLVWVVHGTFSSKLRDRMHDVRELALTRVATIWAVIVLALFAAKLAAYYATTSLAERCSSWLRPDLCQQVVVPNEFPPWQVASATNAALGLVLFFVADWYLHMLKHQRPAPEGFLDGTIKAVWFVRGFLSLYTIACTIYIAASLTRRWGLPPLGTKFFPWQ